MKKMIFLMLVFCLGITASMNAQVTIGSSANPTPGTVLDLSQTGSKNLGLRLPVVSLSGATPFQLTDGGDGSAAAGTIVYNDGLGALSEAGIYVWDGSQWLAGTSGTVTPPPAEPVSVAITPTGPVTLVATGAGSTQQLSASVLPEAVDQSVTWSGGSSPIATVNVAGLVTAFSGAGGQTTVTATTVATPVRTANVIINVNPAQPSAIITSTSSLAVGEQLTLSVDAVTGDTYTWTYPTANFDVVGDATGATLTLQAKTVSTNLANTFSVVAIAPTHGGLSPARAGSTDVIIEAAHGEAGPVVGGMQTYCYPGEVGCWTITNSKLGTPFSTFYTDHEPGERGYYYEWGNASDACPVGWHLPSTDSWALLHDYLFAPGTPSTEVAQWYGTETMAGRVALSGSLNEFWGVAAYYYRSDVEYGYIVVNSNGTWSEMNNPSYARSVRCKKNN